MVKPKLINTKMNPTEAREWLESIVYEDFAPYTQSAVLTAIEALKIIENLPAMTYTAQTVTTGETVEGYYIYDGRRHYLITKLDDTDHIMYGCYSNRVSMHVIKPGTLKPVIRGIWTNAIPPEEPPRKRTNWDQPQKEKVYETRYDRRDDRTSKNLEPDVG